LETRLSLLTINKVQPIVPRRVPLRDLRPALPAIIAFKARGSFRIDLSLVVDGALGSLARGHVNILDNDSVTVFRGGSDPSSLGASSSTSGKCEVVVDVSGSWLPGLTAVGTDLKLCGTKTSVEDGGSKPVLRRASVHLDLKTIGDGARDKLPLDRDLAEVLVGNLCEHVGRHVQVVLVAASLVGNLKNCLVKDLQYSHWIFSYHSNLLSTTLVNDTHTAAAISPVSPDGLRDAGGAIDGRGEDVVGKGAGALLPASLLTTALTVPGTHASIQGSLKQSRVRRGCRGSKCERCEHQSCGQRRRGGREQHLSKSD
jgi:hypothetical protein